MDIVITADYEIFGNGTGDVQSCLINPTTDLLRICGEFGAKLTLFFEIVEWWAFQKAEAQGKLTHLGCSPSVVMEEQARLALEGGHDVQLHVHPQWLDSEYVSQRWRVNLDYWRLPNVPRGLGSFCDVLSLRGLLYRGKRDLEAMLKPIRSDYECVALRAGGYCIQPARDVIRAMKEVGLLADSSVFKGGFIRDGLFDVDFRDAHSECAPWYADPDNINRAVVNGSDTILEMPICTAQRRRIEKLNVTTILRWFQKRNARRPSDCQGYAVGSSKQRNVPKTPVGFLSYLFESFPTRWDYCNLTDQEMWWCLETRVEDHTNTDGYLPLVMIGHPKNFANQDHFRRFLNRVTRSAWFRNGDIGFSTMRYAVRRAIETAR